MMKSRTVLDLYIKFKSCIVSLLFILTLLPLNAYAADSEYEKNPTKWFERDDVQTVQTSISDTYEGYLRFFYAQNTFYCHISYIAEGMTGDDSVFVDVSVCNDNRQYELVISSESDDDSLPCKIYKNFSNSSPYGQDIYFALEFSEKEDKNVINKVDISLTVNAINYLLAQGLEQPSDETATVNGAAAQTTVRSAEKTTRSSAESSTKYVYSGGNHSSSGATKYTGSIVNGESDDVSLSEIHEENNALSEEGEIIPVSQEKTESLSPAAKGLLVLAAVFALCGIGFLVKYAVRSKQALKAEESEISKADEADVSDEAVDYDA